MRAIPLSVPVIEGNEWRYVKECLDAGWVSYLGWYVEKFEERVAKYVGTQYSVATVNGTSALHIGLIACGIAAEDEVIVPTLTFIAPVNAVKYCGAEPIFMDCDPRTLCIDVDKVIDFLKNNTRQRKDGFTYNKISGRRIKAIIPVHIFGHPVDMDPLLDICKQRSIYLIEDAAESLGSQYKGKQTGSFGDIGCFSFNGNKIITAGGGGMLVTNNRVFASKIRHLISQAKINSLECEHDAIGYNYRLSNIQAALGYAQMERLDGYIQKKRANARLYKYFFSNLPRIKFLWEAEWSKSNFWFYTIEVPKRDKIPLMKYMMAKNIQVRSIWKLIHQQNMYKHCQAYHIENAPRVLGTSINIPCSSNLSRRDIEFVIDTIKKYFKIK